ncbi:hypothetical protein K7432_000750 [Basidiobolus ranarum]|uniref:Major facilitator superfamily (MFS) profile domain-containing protein n=1 Tax=Basidiobolus ranarum TaxID=34480 RepID=A0ABR2X462_9FUNG
MDIVRNALHSIPKRHVIVVLCAMSVVISYADRSNISIAIIPMSAEYSWSSTTRGLILSSFFYGYFCTQVLGGFLADKFGGKGVLALGAFLWSLFTLVTPWVAHNLALLIVCRLLLGAGEGLGFPAIHSLIAKWIPHHESSRAVAAVTAASYAGAILALLISAPIAASSLGWRWIFYIFAIMGFGWNIPWYLFSASSPDQHSGTSPFESLYGKERDQDCPAYVRVNSEDHDSFHERPESPEEIEDSIEQAHSTESDEILDVDVVHSPVMHHTSASSGNNIPWGDIFASKEVWAILLNQFCNSWGFYVLLSWLPTYYKDVFDVDLNELGYFSGMLYSELYTMYG